MLKQFAEEFDGIEKPMPYHAAVAQGIQGGQFFHIFVKSGAVWKST